MSVRELAAQFLALAEKQGATVPLMIGHRLMGILAAHGRRRGRPSALRSGARALRSCRASSAGDAIWPRYRRVNFIYRSCALWLLGYPEAALADADRALKDAREIGHAATLDVCAGITVPISSAGITRQQTALAMNLSLWRTKKAPCCGRRAECAARLRFCPDR